MLYTDVVDVDLTLKPGDPLWISQRHFLVAVSLEEVAPQYWVTGDHDVTRRTFSVDLKACLPPTPARREHVGISEQAADKRQEWKCNHSPAYHLLLSQLPFRPGCLTC